MNAQVGKHYSIDIETENGNETVKTDNIGDTLITLLENYKRNGVSNLDIKRSRGILEQHFMELARRNVE